MCASRILLFLSLNVWQAMRPRSYWQSVAAFSAAVTSMLTAAFVLLFGMTFLQAGALTARELSEILSISAVTVFKLAKRGTASLFSSQQLRAILPAR